MSTPRALLWGGQGHGTYVDESPAGYAQIFYLTHHYSWTGQMVTAPDGGADSAWYKHDPDCCDAFRNADIVDNDPSVVR